MLDYALGHPFLAQTNFKYGDFLLKNLHPNSSIEEIIDDIELIKEFDRFQQSLEEKVLEKIAAANVLIAKGLLQAAYNEMKKGQKIADRLQRKVREGEQLVVGVKDDLKDTLNGINRKINQFT